MEQTFNNIIDLIYSAKRDGVEFILNGERLQLKIADNRTVDKDLLEEIKNNKTSIIDFLNSNSWKSKKVDVDHNKINRFNRDEIEHVPLSFSQERLWFIDHLEGSLQYHSLVVLRLKGGLSEAALSHSLKTIVDRHEILRTVYGELDGSVYQYLLDSNGWKLSIIDGTGLIFKPNGLHDLVQDIAKQPFDLASDYMLRGSLISLNDHEHILAVTLHHIACDGWSIPIIVREVVELYSSYKEGRKAHLTPLNLQYADYAVWQRKHLQGEILDRKLNYWKEKLLDVSPLQLAGDFSRPSVRTYNGDSAYFKVDKPLLVKLHELSRQNGCSLYMTVLSVFKVLLHRYSNQHDICVGTSIANRTQQEIEGLVGFFVNTLALRTQVSSETKFTDLLSDVRSTTLEAYENQEVPFEKIVEAVMKERDPGRTPVFQVMLVLRNTPETPKLRLDEVSLSVEDHENKISKFDLTFVLTESPGGLHVAADYSSELFTFATIDRMLLHFGELLQSVVLDPSQQVGLLPMTTAGEKHHLLSLGQSKAAYPRDKTVVALFEEQVQKTPSAIAVVFEGAQLTYEQLNTQANQVAHYLREQGIKEDTLVPLCIERSLQMMVGLLGILKAGAAYVPIDTDFPQERISYMLRDTKADIVVSSKASRSKVQPTTATIIEIDGEAFKDQPTGNPQSSLQAHHLAYIIYTSGSTGMPKGVMIEHRHLTDYVFGLNQQTQTAQCASYALVSTLATDLGNTVLYSSLLLGGTLHLFSKEAVSNIEYLHRYFHEHTIDCLKIVPSHWKALSPGEQLLLPQKLLVFGGEALQKEITAQISLAGAGCKVVNHYGPTETTIGKLLHLVEANKSYNHTIPIGKPFSNTAVYVLSKSLQLCPIGVPGQLYIAGDGVARGYLNNEELTREKFIQNPFHKDGNNSESNSHSLMYATGDLVKYLADGNIAFIGRVDDQVKIRGYRIEPGEIESILQQSELVSQAAVLARADKQGNLRLVGYIVAEDGWFDREGILSYLETKLPDYMIPSLLVELESLPLTANGKVDRKALPDPEASELLKEQYTAPRNAAEERLASLWQDVLEVEQVGVHDDFFELGGHSLLAVRLISAIRKEFTVEMPISDIFDYPTVAQLAGQLSVQADTTVLPSIEVVQPRPERIPLSFSQERLWFIDRLEGSVQYHVPAVLRLKGLLNEEALSASLFQIVQRHEVLRSVILSDDGKPYQSVQEGAGWQLEFVDGAKYKDDKAELLRSVNDLTGRQFDLSNDYMIRAHLISFEKDDNLLVVTLHHIASDGWSKSVLVKELVEIYSSIIEGRTSRLPALQVQYADYSIWQRKYLQGEVLDKKLAYWRKKLDDVAPQQLPTDFLRPAISNNKGAVRSFFIDKDLAEQLQSLGQQHGSTIFMTLLAAFNVLLYRYSNQSDICVGSPVAGRQLQDVEDLVGFFVNTLALRNEVNGEESFLELLQQVRVTTLGAYKHQDVPFEKIVDEVVKERDMNLNPLFQVMFVLRNTPEVPELRLGEIKLSPQGYGHTTALFDLAFFITETASGLQGVVEYSTELYKEETIVRLLDHYKQLLGSIVTNPLEKIGKLSLLGIQEEQKLLVEFNETVSSYPKDKSITNLITEQAVLSPNALAVLFADEQLTYKELEERTNRLAHYLHNKGVDKETLVGICVERSIEMIVGLIGILKAGGVFLPIDPDYPKERIRYMLNDSNVNIILSSGKSRYKLEGSDNKDIVELDGDWDKIEKFSTASLPVIIEPENLAYIIYTSGSTGDPKGVMVEHRSVVNLLKSFSNETCFTSCSVFLALTTYSFDISYLEFFMPLINGGKLVVIPRETALDGFSLSRSIARYSPTHLQGTPATWQLLLESGWHNNEKVKILIGGERVTEDIKESLTSIGEVWNVYGPTETTIWSTTMKLERGQKVLIGKPIANTTLYVLSEFGQLCPIGVPGELYIGGDGLARGYLKRPELTAQKFVANPFAPVPGLKIYRTGDMVRWLSDGNIEYIGRSDNQVKIRGYRIEIGEVESVLEKCQIIKQSVILAKESKDGSNALIAYYVPDEDIVREREKDLYEEQVAGWREIYDTNYRSSIVKAADEEFDIGIWIDSFTGELIAAEQMVDWIEDIVEVIKPESAGNVLEIGCGTGLIYYRLAGKVKKYIGTDFSSVSINQIQQRIDKGLREYGETELKVCAAHEISLNKDEKIDTIILNSVVQYFSGEIYLRDVIDNSISLLEGQGRIVIGDVRDNRLLELFKSRLNLQKLQSSVGIRDFNWAVAQEVSREEELCISPEYFYQLRNLYPQITHVDIQWKQTSFVNEMSLYRYTVVIYVGIEKEVIAPEWVDWKDLEDNNSVVNKLKGKASLVAIKNAPNFRLQQERLLNKAIVSNSVSTVGDLLEVVNGDDNDGKMINEVLNVARDSGYHFQLLLNEDPLLMNVVFSLQQLDGFISHSLSEKKIDQNISLTNIPLFSNISDLLQKDIRSILRNSLPEYMVPSEFIALTKLPLTANGKVDRLFLSKQAGTSAVNRLKYQAPQNELQQKLADIWSRLLGIDRIGILDNFFEIGGHSLLAMRLVAAIRKTLSVELPISYIFTYPTVALMASELESQSSATMLPVIEVAQPRPAFLPLSFSQERLWFIDKLEGSIQYHIPAVLKLRGAINKEALSYSLKTVVDRHEVLRSVYSEQDGRACQVIKEPGQWHLNFTNGFSYNQDRSGLQTFIQKIISHPFDLSQDDMMRANLISISEDEHILIVTLHHIAADGWSRSILVKEVAELYNAYEQRRPFKLEPLPVQYADYALWQRKYLDGEILEKKLSYWKNKLKNAEPLQLPTDYARPAFHSNKGAVESFKLDKETSLALQALSRREGTTLFMTMLAAFKVLLYRYSGQQDISVGTPIAGRPQQELEELIGFFLNTITLRTSLDSQQSFTQFLQQVRTTTMEAYEHQEVPFEKVVEAVVKERDSSRTPLFQVMLILQNTPEVQQLTFGETRLTNESFGHDNAKFDITLALSDNNGVLSGGVEYNTELFSSTTINRMIEHFKMLVASIVRKPQQKISALTMLTEVEQSQLQQFTNTAVSYPKNKTLINLFEEQVFRTPKDIAAVYHDQHLTFEELNKQANRLARHLQQQGVVDQTIVPICIERSFDMIVGVLAILKAGGIYIPIDADYPQDRINYMVEDSGAAVLVTNSNLAGSFKPLKNLTVVVVSDGTKADVGDENLTLNFNDNSTACIIYTSGSTGKPKGVKLSHAGIVNRMYWMWNTYPFATDERIAFKTSIGFGDHIWELFGSITNGTVAVVFRKEDLLDLDVLLQKLSAEKITRLVLVPSLLRVLLEKMQAENLALPYLKYWTCSGETLSSDLVTVFYKVFSPTSHKLLNIYGSSEVSADVTYYDTSVDYNHAKEIEKNSKLIADHNIPIGKPLSNCTIYIVDKDFNLVPQGAVGEICVAGIQVAQGYLNKPELTAEKFVPDPFSNDASKMFRTGDLGRWIPNGNIEFLGRFDNQVKIRGNRVELGEIESILLNSGLLHQVVVLAKDDSHRNKRLVGYAVANGTLNKQLINTYLAERLPDYMIPSLWIELEELPLTPNGKIDKMALPDLDAGELLTNKFVAPRNDSEIILAKIWQKSLNVGKVGIHDNFFDLGGHSILAMRLLSAIRKHFVVELGIRDFFVNPTIAQLAVFIEGLKNQKLFATTKFKSLIPINMKGNKSPLYIVCGAGGTVFKFKNFVDLLDPLQPVYGLQQSDKIEDAGKFPDTIEGIASLYLEEILVQNPHGPYSLSGHCVGGLIAFEMAKKLKAMGKEVKLLAMLDTIINRRNILEQQAANRFSYRLKRSMSALVLKVQFETFLLRKHPRHAIQYKLRKLMSISEKFSKKKEGPHEQNGLDVFYELSDVYRAAVRKYEITPYDGTIIVFYAKDHYYFLDKERNVGFKKLFLSDRVKNFWKDYANDTVMYEIDGEHSLIFDPNNAERFARILQEHLDTA